MFRPTLLPIYSSYAFGGKNKFFYASSQLGPLFNLIKFKSSSESTSGGAAKKYTNKPPIDLKSVRTNQSADSKENEGAPPKSSKITPLLLLTLPAIAFGLGVWQVYRRENKLKLIEFLETRTKSEPRELPKDSKELENLVAQNEYRPYRVKGHFLHSKEILLTLRHDLTGQTHLPGGWVITPFVSSANPKLIILVNRGYVPYTNFSPMHRIDGQIEKEVEVIGLLRTNEPTNTFTPVNKPPNEWHYRDINLMAQSLGIKLFILFKYSI
jgi:surfeit locus 1 family protein